MTNGIHCTQCGGTQLEPGYLNMHHHHKDGDTHWHPGTPDHDMLGMVAPTSRPHWTIYALRCVQCGHLELFATQFLY